MGDVIQLLTDLLGPRLAAANGTSSWPAKVEFHAAGQVMPVELYLRPVGSSSRGNAFERRFQNPSSRHPIRAPNGSYAFVWGIWTEQGAARTVLVAFDAYRRIGKTTRFSMFMPLTLLERAAETGYATHRNTKGEEVYAFRPENVGRYLVDFLSGGTWGEHDPGLRTERGATEPLKVQQNESSEESVYIRPRVGMYAAFARLNYKPWFALAEFLDNSLQSYVNEQDRLRATLGKGPLVVDIELDDNELSITDRAGGIAAVDFPRAFSPSALPTNTSGLSEFGLGMKAAACWFAKRWSVRTSALGEADERTIVFDVAKISRDGLEHLQVERRPAREADHFTVVTLQDLRVRPRGRTVGKIKEHLASIYRVLLREGRLRIRFTASGQTEELVYEYPELLQAPYHRTPAGPALVWRKNVDVESDGRRVHGWAGILRHGSYTAAGFGVLRRGRLIEGSIGDAFRPHAIFGSPNSYASQRVVGELFVEGFDVTHTKDGIQWDGREDDIIDAIRRSLDQTDLPLLDQANGYRARKSASSLAATFGAKAVATVEGALTQTGAAAALATSGIAQDDGVNDVVPAVGDDVFLHRSIRVVVPGQRKPWDVNIELIRDSVVPWYDVSIQDGHDTETIKVRINLEHDFSVTYINGNEGVLEPLLKIVTALALGEVMARKQGVRSVGTVRRNANTFLRTVLVEAPVNYA